MMAAMIYGLPIYPSPLAVKTTGKEHIRRRWHKHRSYHRRIAKKWAKRYGPPKHEPLILRTPSALFVHPSLMPKLMEALRNGR